MPQDGKKEGCLKNLSSRPATHLDFFPYDLQSGLAGLLTKPKPERIFCFFGF
jgi:hypothetical protein